MSSVCVCVCVIVHNIELIRALESTSHVLFPRITANLLCEARCSEAKRTERRLHRGPTRGPIHYAFYLCINSLSIFVQSI